MNVVILNWRDIKNPLSGGAEILTHEIAKYLIGKKHTVTIFSSLFPNCKKMETIDGVKIIRDGKPDLRSLFNSVHYKAYKYYKDKKFGVVDIFVDEVHGVPFFTPLYIKEKKIALICEKAGSLWDFALPFPLNHVGRLTERVYPLLYKNIPIVTISQSSKDELSSMFPKEHVKIIYPGSSSKVLNLPVQKDNNMKLVFIARLLKTKGIEDVIDAVKIIKDRKIEVKLHVIGRGTSEYTKQIHEKILHLNLLENVVLHGYISEKEKNKVIDDCHFLVAPSQKEGWGLTVHEVGARGVPAISYTVPGLKEVVVDGINGRLTKGNTPRELADLCVEVFNNKQLYKKLQKGAIEQRKKYTWNNTGDEFLKIIYDK